MKGRTAASVLGIGVAGSQAGHLLVYTVRFGPAAQHMQSAGAHTYFPSLAKTVIGLIAIVAVAALLVIAVARVTGKRAERDTAPPYIRLLAVLFTIQLVAYAVQETAESLVTGAPVSVPLILVWGTFGQLPLAAVGALALRWLLERIRPALARLALLLEPAFQLLTDTTALVFFPVATERIRVAEPALATFNRRGPPSY